MSYCRFAWDGSDVYVYFGQGGYVCCGCRIDGDHVTPTPERMILHLAMHRRGGDFVPEYAITALWHEVEGRTAPRDGEPPSLTALKLRGNAAALNRMADELKAKEEADEQDAQDAAAGR